MRIALSASRGKFRLAIDNYPSGVTDKTIDEFWGEPQIDCSQCYFWSGECTLHEKRENCPDFERSE